ncbi:PREDICTED: transcription elongation factor TFIIS-like [Prunus mume]|uniref:DNA-directed RNA polymerase I subunit RPA12 n=1 Tax=Prunus mume TaxID=102107 RepID=A0ABM1LQI6_PRUMU|nr:PREDICTED: transcription elongation factor TFIIS-like [Prunus mume]
MARNMSANQKCSGGFKKMSILSFSNTIFVALFVSPNQGITLYVSLLQDIRRELGISIICEEKVQLQKTDAKTCEKCGHNEHTYYSRQMRSADEGATTFYACTNCQHQFTEN